VERQRGKLLHDVNVDKNKWSVVKGAATVAVWSK